MFWGECFNSSSLIFVMSFGNMFQLSSFIVALKCWNWYLDVPFEFSCRQVSSLKPSAQPEEDLRPIFFWIILYLYLTITGRMIHFFYVFFWNVYHLLNISEAYNDTSEIHFSTEHHPFSTQQEWCDFKEKPSFSFLFSKDLQKILNFQLINKRKDSKTIKNQSILINISRSGLGSCFHSFTSLVQLILILYSFGVCLKLKSLDFAGGLKWIRSAGKPA